MRGLGDWPLGSRFSQSQMITMVCSERPGSFRSAATHPRPSPGLSRKEAGRGDLPNCQRRAELERSPRRRRHRPSSTRNGAARKFSCLQVIEKSRNQKILAPPSPTGAAQADAPARRVRGPSPGRASAVRAARVTLGPLVVLPPRIDKFPPFGLPAHVSRRHPAEKSGVASAIPAPKAQPPRKRSGQWTVG